MEQKNQKIINSMREKTTRQKINEIIERQYNGYRGNAMSLVGIAHTMLREAIGDYLFLAYLEKQERDNPKPVYQLPEHLLNS
jgi:hypothetical protein